MQFSDKYKDCARSYAIFLHDISVYHQKLGANGEKLCQIRTINRWRTVHHLESSLWM